MEPHAEKSGEPPPSHLSRKVSTNHIITLSDEEMSIIHLHHTQKHLQTTHMLNVDLFLTVPVRWKNGDGNEYDVLSVNILIYWQHVMHRVLFVSNQTSSGCLKDVSFFIQRMSWPVWSTLWQSSDIFLPCRHTARCVIIAEAWGLKVQAQRTTHNAQLRHRQGVC